jgi:hypothetical protein
VPQAGALPPLSLEAALEAAYAASAAGSAQDVAPLAALLRSAGVTDGAALAAASDASLEALGVKKGPRMKLRRWRGEAGTGTAAAGEASPAAAPAVAVGQEDWVVFNDFAVAACSARDALAFHEQPWREPCVLVYRLCPSSDGSRSSEDGDFATPSLDEATAWLPPLPPPLPLQATGSRRSGGAPSRVSESVFDLPSLAAPRPHPPGHDRHASPQLRHPPTFRNPPAAVGWPGAGDVVALDTEFVSVCEEEGVTGADGTRTVVAAARQALARVSAVDGRTREVRCTHPERGGGASAQKCASWEGSRRRRTNLYKQGGARANF